jgi:hypothetical protein
VLAPGSPQGVAGVVAGGYPTQCGGVLPMTPSAPERLKVGARNVAMDFLEKQLPALGQLERPLVDGTGLSDALDFTPEWVPDVTGGSPPTPDFSPDPNGPSFSPALKDQLGLKLNSQKGTSEALIIDPPGTAERELKPFLHRAATIIHVIHVFGSAGRGQGAHAPSIAIPRFAAHRSHARDIQPGSAVIPSALSGGPRVR